MELDPPKPRRRRSIRLKGYDYAQPGAYFVTICVQNRECLLGEIADAQMRLNAVGAMAQTQWQKLPERFPRLALDAFVFMPNHMHGIILIGAANGASAPDGESTIGASVGAGLVPAPDEESTLGASTRDAPTISSPAALGDIIGAFKSITTHEYIIGVRQLGWPPFARKFWQRNYYEHVIRDEADLARLRVYIQNNPAQWALDQLHPAAPPSGKARA